jgi:hypothetical protein
MQRAVFRLFPGWTAVALATAGVIATVFASLSPRAGDVHAIAPCVAHSPSAEETTFLGLLQSWRNANIAGSYPLSQSGALNAAAAGYAQFLANTPGASGHYADGTTGYPWATRAMNCGYPANQAAGGEGLAVVQSSNPVSVSPQQALNTMTSEGGGGVWVPSNVGLPVRCVGVAKAVSADGKKVAWVTLIFASSGTCPGGTGGGSTQTTPTTTPSPTPTSTPTPSVYRSWFSLLSRD